MRLATTIAARPTSLSVRRLVEMGAEGEGKVAALARTFWTPEEDNRLRMLLGAGRPIEIVATELKRSAKAVKGRAYILRISLKRVKLKPKAKGK
jgi:hypothetical protein